MKEPVDHIQRPRLPWRPETEPAITECGFDASKVKTLSREAYFARLKEYGQQRAALLTCMTCSQTASRWPAWAEDPRLALEREINWENPRWRGEKRDRLKYELQAIEALLAAHPEEFQKILSDMEARRQWLEKKEPSTPKPKKSTKVHW